MKKLDYEFVKQQFKKVGYRLLSKEYKNARTKLLVECPEKHRYKVTYSCFHQGFRCPICYHNKRKYSYTQIKRLFDNEKYKILSEKYENSYTKLSVECPEGHEYKVTYHDFQQGYRCPICYDIKTYSHSEKDCLNVVKQLTNENIIENDRTQIMNPNTDKHLELDIWIPTLKT